MTFRLLTTTSRSFNVFNTPVVIIIIIFFPMPNKAKCQAFSISSLTREVRTYLLLLLLMMTSLHATDYCFGNLVSELLELALTGGVLHPLFHNLLFFFSAQRLDGGQLLARGR